MLTRKSDCCYRKNARGEEPQLRSGSRRARGHIWELRLDRKGGGKSPHSKLLHAIVGGFAGDDYVVDVTFAKAGGGDADEAAVGGEFF